jgi:hypothetical protein
MPHPSFRRKIEGIDRPKPAPVVEAVISRVRRATELYINKHGGTGFSVIRNLFVKYDRKSTGLLE